MGACLIDNKDDDGVYTVAFGKHTYHALTYATQIGFPGASLFQGISIMSISLYLIS